MPINSPSTVAALAALQAAWRKKYAGKGGSDVAPAVGSTPAQNQAAAPRPTRTPSTSSQALDPHRSETETEAAAIRRRNQQIRDENAWRRGKAPGK